MDSGVLVSALPDVMVFLFTAHTHTHTPKSLRRTKLQWPRVGNLGCFQETSEGSRLLSRKHVQFGTSPPLEASKGPSQFWKLTPGFGSKAARTLRHRSALLPWPRVLPGSSNFL